MWDEAEIVAIDDKLPEGEERPWATKNTRRFFFTGAFVILTYMKQNENSG